MLSASLRLLGLERFPSAATVVCSPLGFMVATLHVRIDGSPFFGAGDDIALPKEASDTELGSLVRAALSRTSYFETYPPLQSVIKKARRRALNSIGVKSNKEFETGSAIIDVVQRGKALRFTPSLPSRPGTYVPRNDWALTLRQPDDTQIGANIRQLFMRCRPSEA